MTECEEIGLNLIKKNPNFKPVGHAEVRRFVCSQLKDESDTVINNVTQTLIHHFFH